MTTWILIVYLTVASGYSATGGPTYIGSYKTQAACELTARRIAEEWKRRESWAKSQAMCIMVDPS